MSDAKNILSEEPPELHGVSLTAVDVLQQKFPTKFRGYDTQDVDSFLEVVAKEMERLSNENNRFEDELIAARHDIELFRKKEESINAALVTVQKLADDVKQRAVTESERMLSEAKRETEGIITAAQERMKTQQEEIRRLREKAESEARRLVDTTQQESERIMAEAQAKTAKRYEEADSIKDQAQRESRKLLDESRLEADTIVENARTKSSALQDEAGRIRMRAEDEARAIIDKARSESAQTEENLQRAKIQVQEEIAILKQRKIQFEASFRALIDTHLKLMEGSERDPQQN